MCNTIIIIGESIDVHRQFDKHVEPQLRLATTCVKLVQYSHIRIQQATEMCGFPYECRKSN